MKGWGKYVGRYWKVYESFQNSIFYAFWAHIANITIPISSRLFLDLQKLKKKIKKTIELKKTISTTLNYFSKLKSVKFFHISGYTKTHSVDHDDQMKVMKKSVDALGKVFGTEYRYGPISEVGSL